MPFYKSKLEVFISLVGRDEIDNPSEEGSAIGEVLAVVSSSALIVNVLDEVDIDSASVSEWSEVVFVA